MVIPVLINIYQVIDVKDKKIVFSSTSVQDAKDYKTKINFIYHKCYMFYFERECLEPDRFLKYKKSKKFYSNFIIAQTVLSTNINEINLTLTNIYNESLT